MCKNTRFFEKRVQKYCFFLKYANIFTKKMEKNVFSDKKMGYS